MTKHKKFHSLTGKGKAAKTYAFHHRANAFAAALQQSQKNTAPCAANTQSGGKVEKVLGKPDSASNDN